MQIQSSYFLAKLVELLSLALGVQFKFDRLATHFCRLSAVETKLVLMHVPLLSVLGQVHVSRVRAHTQLGAAPHLALTYSGGFGKGLSLSDWCLFLVCLVAVLTRLEGTASHLCYGCVCVEYITDFLSSYIFFTFIRSFVLCVCVTYTHVHAMEHVWRLEDSLWKSGLSLYHVNSTLVATAFTNRVILFLTPPSGL